MASDLLDNRNRAIGASATLVINALLVMLLMTLSSDIAPPASRAPGLSTFDIAQPPPPPPDTKPAGAAAPPSRGTTKAPSRPKPLPSPTPAEPAPDVGSQSASGAGSAAGSGAGQGGQGNGSGSGASGTGTGGGAVTAPVHVSGSLSDADYARSGLPKGAAGTVLIGFRVRSDGGVDRCRTVRSSGYAAIDRDTCRLVEQRFRFRPARDAAGRPIDYSLQTDFTWRPR